MSCKRHRTGLVVHLGIVVVVIVVLVIVVVTAVDVVGRILLIAGAEVVATVVFGCWLQNSETRVFARISLLKDQRPPIGCFDDSRR